MFKIFIAVLFLLFYVHKFLNPLNSVTKNEEWMRIAYDQEKVKEFFEENPKKAIGMILGILGMMTVQIIEFFYHISLLKVEQLKTVSLLMISWFIFEIVKQMIKNKRLKKDVKSGERLVDKMKSKKHLLKIRIHYTIDIIYFTYVLFILISNM